MATYNLVFTATRFKTIESAKKHATSSEVFDEYNGIVYRKIWSGAMRGTIKQFIEDNHEGEDHYGMNFNGYGYSDHVNRYYMNTKQAKSFVELVEGKKQTKKVRTQAELTAAWCRKLVKLTGISLEQAQQIAEEKLNYKQKQVDELESRQYESYSVKREKLINQIQRSNPLRPIKDEEHANAILAASHRHNDSDYEQQLKVAQREARLGNIGFWEVQETARRNMTFSK